MRRRIASLLLAGLLLETGLATTAGSAPPSAVPELARADRKARTSDSLIEAAGVVRGREISPPTFMLVVAGLGLLLQAARVLGRRGQSLVRGMTTLLIFLFLWELAVWLHLVTTILLPPPTVVLQRLDALWQNGYLHWHLFSTLRRFLLSFGLAVVTAFPLGVLVANFPRLFSLLDPVITFVRMIPSPAWAPLAILWLGLGDSPAIFIVWLAIFFPIFLNTIRGIHDTLPIYREVIRTLGGSRWDEIVKATIPVALPVVVTGVRVGFGVGWVVLAAAELIAVDSGLGWLIQVAYTQVDSPAVLAAMTLICWMGVVLDTGLRTLERRLISW